MIGYVTVGARDVSEAGRFYRAFLPALGYRVETYHGDLSFLPPNPVEGPQLRPDFYVKAPFNGEEATAGNGVMVAFDAGSQAQVRALHAAALAAGGADVGAPGFRESYSADFYVGYLRDPTGNKVALFSCDPSEPGRDG